MDPFFPTSFAKHFSDQQVFKYHNSRASGGRKKTTTEQEKKQERKSLNFNASKTHFNHI